MEKNKPFANLFYFKGLCHIGGTEQFLYEIAKKYHEKDVTVLYDWGDLEQVVRLKGLVRCIRREPGKIYYAKKAFYNYNLDAIDFVEADEHIFVCHAIYRQLPLVPPLTNPKLTGFIGVSDYASTELKKSGEFQDVKISPRTVYNPLTLEKPDKVVRLISACRLNDEVKGGARTVKMIEALDRYCEEHGTHYLWFIYSNRHQFKVNSPNVCYMDGRTDIRPFIADADYLVQVSNDMESYCYTINEALGLGTRIIRTPLTVAKELKIPKSAEIVLDWNCENIDKVAAEIFKQHKPFTYKPPKDDWAEILVDEPANYVVDKTITVQPIRSYYDLERKEQMSKFDEPFDVSLERAKKLVKIGFVRVV